MSGLRVASLFSGIGLIDHGLSLAGIPTGLLCESDKACRRVLAHHHPDTPIHDDVRTLTGDDLRAAGLTPGRTVLAGGFPCQDLSVAGRRAGMGRGTRSGLYWQIVRLLGEFPARWVVLENVLGLLSSHGGRDMGAVIGSLADLGYGYAWRVLDAQYAGVPQRRRRIVIVGHLGTPWSAPAQVLLEPDSGGRHPAALGGSGAGTAGRAAGGAGSRRVAAALAAHHGRNNADTTANLVADTLTSGRKSGGQGIMTTTGVRRLTPMECERLQGAPDGWTAVGRQKDSPRYRQLGNAVAVPVFRWVGQRLVAIDAAMREVAA